MAYALKSFKEILAATKETIDDVLAPVRARAVKAKAELYKSELEERMINLEKEINTLCTDKEPNISRILDKIDDYELVERRYEQAERLVAEMFPL